MSPGIVFLLLLFWAVVAMVRFWIRTFVEMMRSEVHRFAGPRDKLIWGAVFIVLPFLAPFAWRSFLDDRRHPETI